MYAIGAKNMRDVSKRILEDYRRGRASRSNAIHVRRHSRAARQQREFVGEIGDREGFRPRGKFGVHRKSER
jgi:hypothetical protein